MTLPRNPEPGAPPGQPIPDSLYTKAVTPHPRQVRLNPVLMAAPREMAGRICRRHNPGESLWWVHSPPPHPVGSSELRPRPTPHPHTTAVSGRGTYCNWTARSCPSLWGLCSPHPHSFSASWSSPSFLQGGEETRRGPVPLQRAEHSTAEKSPSEWPVQCPGSQQIRELPSSSCGGEAGGAPSLSPHLHLCLSPELGPGWSRCAKGRELVLLPTANFLHGNRSMASPLPLHPPPPPLMHLLLTDAGHWNLRPRAS